MLWEDVFCSNLSALERGLEVYELNQHTSGSSAGSYWIIPGSLLSIYVSVSLVHKIRPFFLTESFFIYVSGKIVKILKALLKHEVL